VSGRPGSRRYGGGLTGTGLGGFVREHRTDGARRLRQAGIWLIAGAAGTAVGLPTAIASVDTTDGAPELAGLLLGIGLMG
jgi:hypothetical protein